MAEKPRLSMENRVKGLMESENPSPERMLKNFRYVVGSVNESALHTWADLWRELQGCATPGGMVTPTENGFQPSCGWAEFLEKFWLLKHYLDYVHRFCHET